MGLMTFLRNRAGYILVGAIAFAIIAFIVGDVINTGQPFWAASQRVVGTIDGEDVSIDEFGQKVEQSLAQFKQQYGGNVNPQMQAMAVDNAWQAEVGNVLLKKEYERLGFMVSGDELFDLLQGKNPSPLILQYFGNPQTGEFDRAAVIGSLKARTTNPQLKQQWDLLEQEVEKQALQQKYANLIRNSIYVTSLEANEDYINRNKLASFRYVSLAYNTIADDAVKLTDEDFQNYYNERKSVFNNPVETRGLEYVSFSIQPTAADSASIKEQINKLAVDFKVTPNDSLFSANNSDVKVPYAYITKGKLDPAVDSVIFNYPVGSYYGPVFSGNSYKLIKVVGSRFAPDSVKARHILVDPAKIGGEANAFKIIDSLKNLVQKGADFADLAKKYSVDGSKDQGGDLGTFGPGAMVPEFDNAAFTGKTGDLKVVKTQFGVHLIHIQKQVGSSKTVKLAYIEKTLAASSKTRDMAYKKANAFLNEVKPDNFAAVAKKQGYVVNVADRVAASQGYVAGLENPRELIRSAYGAKKGEVLTEVFNMENAYVVARLTSVQPKGQLALADVKTQIEPAVRTAKKGKMLAEKMNKALSGASSIDQVAQKLGQQVTPLQNIVFANPVIPGVAQENKLVGSVFGSSVGKLSKAVEGSVGVYAFVVDGFTNPAPIGNTYKQKQSMMEGLAQRSLGAAFQTLQDKAEIKDNRVKFY